MKMDEGERHQSYNIKNKMLKHKRHG